MGDFQEDAWIRSAISGSQAETQKVGRCQKSDRRRDEEAVGIEAGRGGEGKVGAARLF